jgi:V/A-type H+-transporting ATPase subunit B
LYSAYAQYNAVKSLATIIGEEGLGTRDRDYLRFGERFEKNLINQGKDENRTIEETLNIAWDTLAILPDEELIHVHPEYIEKYYPKKSQEVK